MKKQIAVMMAAATAVTTVAPVLANADVNENNNVAIADINKKIEEALKVRYASKMEDGITVGGLDEVDDYLNSRYAIFIENSGITDDYASYGLKKLSDTPYEGLSFEGVPTTGVLVVTDAVKAAKAVEKGVLSGQDVAVYVVDKGIEGTSSTKKVSNQLYVTGATNVDKDEVGLNETITKLKGMLAEPTFIEKLEYKKVGNDKSLKVDSTTEIADAASFELTLKHGEKLSVSAGDEVLDFEKAYDKDGKELTLGENVDQSVYDEVVKFGMVENKDGKMKTVDVVSGDTEKYTVKDIETTTIDLPNLYTTETGYTKSGANFINKLIDAKKENGLNKFNHNGVDYTLVETDNDKMNLEDAVIKKNNDTYELKFNFKVKDTNDADMLKNLQIAIKGNNQKDLKRVLDDLKMDKEVVAGYFKKLAGSDRTETAIEVSSEAFDDNAADTVVVVGSEALIDGLSAAPLASAKNAPVLLANPKSGLSEATLKEIDRVTDSFMHKTVYIVGGENSVPASVEKQLEERFGVVVVRVAGIDRYQTSLDVAKRLSYDGNLGETAYFVGGLGAADAMSIAPVAAKLEANTPNNVRKVSPILVVPQESVSRTVRDFLKEKQVNKGVVVGGEKKVSSNVYKALNMTITSVDRVSGNDRYDTNLEIINKYYKHGKVGGAIFTNGEDRYLVDAQASASLALKKNAPIVLTDSKLTDDQIDLMKKDDGVLNGLKTDIYQVGGVVSADVMKTVVDKLGL